MLDYIKLSLEILFGKNRFVMKDVEIAKKYKHRPGMGYIAGLTEFGLTLSHTEPKNDILFHIHNFLKGE